MEERDAPAPGGRRVPRYRERPLLSHRRKYFPCAGTCELLFQSVAVAGDGEKDVLPHCNLQVYTYTCDVGKRENVYLTAERVRKEVGEVSVLVNNAGVVSGHHLLECPDELIERTMMVNCHAHFWVTINSFLLPFL
ncbi:hypothetical protein DV515_00000334, partial [Chloebia gouldiae]